MAYYVTAEQALLLLAQGIFVPPDEEVEQAKRVLEISPAVGYPAFAEGEVRLIGVYREALSPRMLSGRIDEVWQAIVEDEFYAWLYAVHEAAELQEFANQAVNPFDRVQWNAHWKQPHLRAVLFELQYLRVWARQLGEEVPELALEMQHPIRGGYGSHKLFVQDVQTQTGWLMPTLSELQAASQFWQQIKKGTA